MDKLFDMLRRLSKSPTSRHSWTIEMLLTNTRLTPNKHIDIQ